MLAATARVQDVKWDDPALVFERKYDGIRCLACADGVRAALYSRSGIDKTRQFPEIAAAVSALSQNIGPVILDGELVALDRDGAPASFTMLQERLPASKRHTRGHAKPSASVELEVSFVAFDILRYADSDLRGLPLVLRRNFLEQVVAKLPPAHAHEIQLSLWALGEGRNLWKRAQEERWEGLIVKGAQSVYTNHSRSPHWRKLKLTQSHTFIVGGYSEANNVEGTIGSLVLGLPSAGGALRPVGAVGSGLTHEIERQLAALLIPLQTENSPFVEPPVLLKEARWVRPQIAVEVKFSEWTPSGSLRHPVFLRLAKQDETTLSKVQGVVHTAAAAEPRNVPQEQWLLQLNQTLRELEKRKADGMIKLPTGGVLRVSNLAKPFWANTGHTKGDLIRHYVDVSPFILPVVAERPLVMKRHPNGAEGDAFYQHRAPEPLPKGARAVALPNDDVPSRLVGGDLFTLLYMAQLGTISQDPWFSTASTPHFACEVAFDLDPMPGVPFSQVRDVALALHEALVALQVPHFAKTSGATGLHIFVPLSEQTAYEPARLFTQIVATMIGSKYPKIATVERTVNARGPKVYIDYLQNIEGKTLACAYSARASAFAGVSTPVTWEEIESGIEPEAFTLSTIAARLGEVGDLWAPVRNPENGLVLQDGLARLAAFQGVGKRR